MVKEQQKQQTQMGGVHPLKGGRKRFKELGLDFGFVPLRTTGEKEKMKNVFFCQIKKKKRGNQKKPNPKTQVAPGIVGPVLFLNHPQHT